MRWLTLALLTSILHLAFAQSNEIPAARLAKPLNLDGIIESEEWEGVMPNEGSYDETTGEPAQEGMKFWIAYDENFVYFAAKLQDSKPDQIQATQYQTNVSLSGDDHIVLTLDLSGSLANFNEFGMNPRGATQIELAGGRAAKREWSGEFVAKGRVTNEGWEVECRIPWGIMQLPAAGKRTIRFNVARLLKRLSRGYSWKYIGGGRKDDTPRWIDVAIPVAPINRTLKLLPYGYLGGQEKKPLIANAGLDLKTNITNEIVAVGSINPDFRNIENSILSLDFSRFERLAGETRPFFQEGAEYMNTALYASQRIDTFDTGINVYGKLDDKTSFGILDTIDFGKRNNFVANFSYNPTPNDSYRLSATTQNDPGRSNDAYLLRYYRTFGPFNLFVRNMGTRDTEAGNGMSNSISVGYYQDGLRGYFGYDATGPNFLPRLGFAPETDYKGIVTGFEYIRPVKSKTFRDVSVVSYWTDYRRFDGAPYRKAFDLFGNLTLANNLNVGSSMQLSEFEGTKEKVFNFNFRYPSGNPYKYAGADYSWGDIENRNYRSIRLTAGYTVIEKLQLKASFQHVEHFEKSDLGIFSWNYDLGNDFYLSGRTVKRDRDWSAYFSFRKSGNRGVEYFLIFGDPNSRRFKPSLILKVIVPLEIGR